MPGIFHWIKENTSKLLDPDRDARIKEAAVHIERELAARRREFSLRSAVAGLGLYHEDVPLAARETYRSLASRAWRDGVISDGERKTLTWAAGTLGLADETVRDLQRDVGLARFEEALARAMDDGVAQSGGRATGQASISCIGSPSSQCRRLDHRHSAARATIPARSALASTYRSTVSRCSSSCTGKDLKRDW
jgi:hypothetical protein